MSWLKMIIVICEDKKKIVIKINKKKKTLFYNIYYNLLSMDNTKFYLVLPNMFKIPETVKTFIVKLHILHNNE